MTVRELSHDPNAIFVRIAAGETIEVTRNGETIALMVPPPRNQSRLHMLITQGAIRPAERDLTAGDWDAFTHIQVPDEADPLADLLAAREHER